MIIRAEEDRRMEEWKIGILEEWTIGILEEWNDGGNITVPQYPNTPSPNYFNN